MAQKRMFDKRVTESDKFIDLPNSSKALYFMAGMDADDRGFFQPKKLQKMCGFSDDDFKILIAKGLFITFESGVVVITDWNKNNWLDTRRLTETEYIDELNMLKLVNNKYELNDCLANAKQTLSQYSIEENSIDKNRKENILKEKNFIKPTLQEVKDYCLERNNNIDAEMFIDFYESKNWYVGKNKMKDWKACIRTWEKSGKRSTYNNKVVKEVNTPNWLYQENKEELLNDKELEELEKDMEVFNNDNV